MAANPQRDVGAPVLRARDAGFTLIEMMVSIVVLALIGTAVSVLVVDTLHTTRSDQSRVRAASLTAQEIEAIRAGLRSGGGIGNTATLMFPWSDSSCLVTAPSCTRLVDGQAFTLTRAVTPIAATGGYAGRLQVTTTASWPQMNGVRPVVNSTVMTARGVDPAAAGDDTPGAGGGPGVGTGTSAVTVTVTGSGGTPYASKPVLLTGPNGAVQATTDASGVAMFIGLPVALYTAKAEFAGYVDQVGNAKAEASITSVANSTVALGLTYAQAATVTYTVTPPTGYATSATSLISTNNVNLTSPKKIYTPAASTGTTVVTTWPSTSLKSWLGTCAADMPGTGIVAVPGSAPSVPLPLGAIQVTVSEPYLVVLKQALKNTDVYAVKDADSGCPASVADPVDGGLAGAVVKFATATSNSGITRVALPPGAWKIKVKNHGPGLLSGLLTGWPTVNVAAGVASVFSMNVDGI